MDAGKEYEEALKDRLEGNDIVVEVVVNIYLNSVKRIFSYTNSILITINFKIKITIKTDLQDCRVGIGCFKCVVDFLLKLPN